MRVGEGRDEAGRDEKKRRRRSKETEKLEARYPGAARRKPKI